ncbi:hypothetical protein K504DRAFT_454932 [Pleomassaria siparia CBS 279.74]|uniref:Uncharacterized protein n=1 Tax=Pleomassaria siparia CBS 279.74 TaxID=1314801 RepID=A0A6G1K9W7_9PLEO|nr:hypothetical protein K504DRAFT_454932 [Pleomassaria siparia CBS 279.74]
MLLVGLTCCIVLNSAKHNKLLQAAHVILANYTRKFLINNFVDFNKYNAVYSLTFLEDNKQHIDAYKKQKSKSVYYKSVYYKSVYYKSVYFRLHKSVYYKSIYISLRTSNYYKSNYLCPNTHKAKLIVLTDLYNTKFIVTYALI